VSRLIAAAVALMLAGCASAPRIIPISVTPGQAPPAAERIADYPEAFQAIGVVMSRDLGLPVPRVSLYLYPHRDAFEEGLKAERHMEPGLARDSASFARGVGGPDKILVNEGALVHTPWPERVKFLAHEFTHTIQFDLARGRRGTSEQWLREGYADWVAFRVLDSLRLGRFADERARRVGQVKHAIDRKPFPPLAELSTFPQWVSWRSRQGTEVTYGQAFLAVDLLIERRGHPAAVDYFRRFARVDDRLGNFRAAFGQDLTAFDREFAAYLRDLRSEAVRDPRG
jgi:hypothetical protein